VSHMMPMFHYGGAISTKDAMIVALEEVLDY
jgi:hypothetical protein